MGIGGSVPCCKDSRFQSYTGLRAAQSADSERGTRGVTRLLLQRGMVPLCQTCQDLVLASVTTEVQAYHLLQGLSWYGSSTWSSLCWRLGWKVVHVITRYPFARSQSSISGLGLGGQFGTRTHNSGSGQIELEDRDGPPPPRPRRDGGASPGPIRDKSDGDGDGGASEPRHRLWSNRGRAGGRRGPGSAPVPGQIACQSRGSRGRDDPSRSPT